MSLTGRSLRVERRQYFSPSPTETVAIDLWNELVWRSFVEAAQDARTGRDLLAGGMCPWCSTTS